MRTKGWAGALALVTVMLTAGCGDDDPITGIGYEPLVGTWDAVAFNNGPLPIVQPFQQGSQQCLLRTTSLRLTFNMEGNFTSTDESDIQCDDNPPVDASDPSSGTYRVQGDRLYLRATGRNEQWTEFELEGNVLIINLYDATGTPAPLELHRNQN